MCIHYSYTLLAVLIQRVRERESVCVCEGEIGREGGSECVCICV